MSSKRGRKRNDNLPPNRARDVQRAFRARRAAHLLALEQRVSELEEENSCLRQALNLPQANRPPLGKGPTGKDKPKTPTDSGSIRESESPVLISTSLPPRQVVQEIENGTGPWEQTIVMTEEVPQYQPLPPMSAPPALQSKMGTYSPAPHPSSRSSSLAPMYMSYNSPSSYSGYFETQQQPPPPPQAQSRSYSYGSPQSQQQSPYSPVESPVHEQQMSPARAVSMAVYPLQQQRRSTGDLQGLGGQHYSHTSLPPTPGGIRLPSPPRALQEQLPQQHEVHDMHNHGHHSQLDPHAHHRAYTSDGRILS
ncbi:DNA helicase [Mycena sanguinolenta]|uniref:DNA helicase n=1 Tax=Mycena sanguinolenta TaxID=230812 RepID=A0A8H7DJ43_9AGAR|nr:DNA helicase [Mycena sanguinolenta]